MTLSIIAVDIKPADLTTIEATIAQNNHLKLVASFTNPLKAIEYLAINTVDLLIIDPDMPQLSSIEIFKKINHPYKVILVTIHNDIAKIAIDKNVIEILNKPLKQIEFDNAVNKAILIIKSDKAILEANRLRAQFELLSVAEKKVLIEIGRGKNNKEIADLLALSINTIDSHKTNIKYKLGFANTQEMAFFGYEICKII
jgi:DNA-binding NarL/FixJ family response regulator